MSNSKLTKVASAVRGTIDRRTFGGIVIGVAFMMSAMAFADSGNQSWFGPLKSLAGSAEPATQALLTEEESRVAKQLKDYPCGPTAAGSVGEAMETALAMRMRLAHATPPVESLFDVNSDCFSSINQLYDLSFAIPSLAGILSKAQDAVLKYAQKKVCTAVNQVTGMVTDPINKAIGDINGMAGFANINGMANQGLEGAMQSLDPALAAQYHPPIPGGTYTTNTNPFNTSQTSFDPNGTGGSGQIDGSVANINQLITQIGNLMIATNQDQQNLSNAQNQLNQCQGNNAGDCSYYEANVEQASAQLAADQQALNLARQQLATAGSVPGANVGTVAMQPAALAGSQSPTQTSTAPKTFWSKVSNMFN